MNNQAIDLNTVFSYMFIAVFLVMAMRMVTRVLEEPEEKPVKMLGYGKAPPGYIPVRHSIHGPERQHLVDLYGTWAVGRAESVCPEGDVPCVEREASRLLGAHRRGYTEASIAYYWSTLVVSTNEIVESSKPYTSAGRALLGARSYAKVAIREGGWLEDSSYKIRVYASLPAEEEGPFREEGVIREVTLSGSELA